MAKKKFKKLSKAEKRLFKETERRLYLLRTMFEAFYPDGMIADFTFPGVDNINHFGWYWEGETIYLNDMPNKEKLEYMMAKRKECEEIRKNIREGISGNVEICLDEGIVRSWNGEYALGNAMVRIHESVNSPIIDYMFLKEGDRCDVRILMGYISHNPYTFLIASNRDEEDSSTIAYIDSFCLMGLYNAGDQEGQKGIMTGNLCEPVNKVIFWLPDDMWFQNIKDLLLMDWLQEDWEKAKAKADEEKAEDIQKKEQKEKKQHTECTMEEQKQALERVWKVRRPFMRPIMLTKDQKN